MRFLTPFVYLLALIALAAVGAIVWIGISFRQFETVTAESQAELHAGGGGAQCGGY